MQYSQEIPSIKSENQSIKIKNQRIISSLSSKETYFKVYYKQEGFFRCNYKSIDPYILVFSQRPSTTIQDLMNLFAQQTERPNLAKTVVWELYAGTKLSPTYTLQELRRMRRERSLNGLQIFVLKRNQKWVDQRAVTALFGNETSFNKKQEEGSFYFKEIDYFIHIPMTHHITLTKVKEVLAQRIYTQLGQQVKKQAIRLFYYKDLKTLPADQYHLNQYYLRQDEIFIVQFTEKITIKPPKRINDTKLVLRFQSEIKIFDYDAIKSKRLIDVLTKFKIIQIIEYGLIIEDEILRPFEYFKKYDKIFKKTGNSMKKLVGFIVPQSLIFEYEREKNHKQELNFQEIIVQEPHNIEKRNEFRWIIENRIKSIDKSHFKKKQNILPIFYYTTDLIVKGTSGEEMRIYDAVNSFMRENNFCTDHSLIKTLTWEYGFASQLYSQLLKIEPIQNHVLWRGISYTPQYQVGQRVHFKQFNSFSLQQSVAFTFAESTIIKIEKYYSAHPIMDYSIYKKTENEVLFEPYLSVQILEVGKKIYNTYFQKEINLIIVREIKKPVLPKMKSIIFLWVDKKQAEGKLNWQKVNEIRNTVVMIQFLSTTQLAGWLDDHPKILEDPQVELVLITNMQREQGGQMNKHAGIDAINLFRVYKPHGTIFVYIGYLKGAIQKLQSNNYEPNQNLIVSNDDQQLVKFLRAKGLQQ